MDGGLTTTTTSNQIILSDPGLVPVAEGLGTSHGSRQTCVRRHRAGGEEEVATGSLLPVSEIECNWTRADKPPVAPNPGAEAGRGARFPADKPPSASSSRSLFRLLSLSGRPELEENSADDKRDPG